MGSTEFAPTQIDEVPMATMKEKLGELGVLAPNASDSQVSAAYKEIMATMSVGGVGNGGGKGEKASDTSVIAELKKQLVNMKDTMLLNQADVAKHRAEVTLMGKQLGTLQAEASHCRLAVFGGPEIVADSEALQFSDLVAKQIAQRFRWIRCVDEVRSDALLQNGAWTPLLTFPRAATAVMILNKSALSPV